jgi:hypothetical protein
MMLAHADIPMLVGRSGPETGERFEGFCRKWAASTGSAEDRLLPVGFRYQQGRILVRTHPSGTGRIRWRADLPNSGKCRFALDAFEAGSLLGAKEPKRIYTYFLGESPDDVKDPFKSLQITVSTEDDTRQLIAALLGQKIETIEEAKFKKCWQTYGKRIEELRTPHIPDLIAHPTADPGLRAAN